MSHAGGAADDDAEDEELQALHAAQLGHTLAPLAVPEPLQPKASKAPSSKARGKAKARVVEEVEDGTPTTAELQCRMQETDEEIVARILRDL